MIDCKHGDYKPQEGTWTLIAPDGRRWRAESGWLAAAKEQNERIPADIRLARLLEPLDKETDVKQNTISINEYPISWANSPKEREFSFTADIFIRRHFRGLLKLNVYAGMQIRWVEDTGWLESNFSVRGNCDDVKIIEYIVSVRLKQLTDS